MTENSFPRPPNQSWKTADEVRNFLENLALKLEVKKIPDDWYRVGISQVLKFGGSLGKKEERRKGEGREEVRKGKGKGKGNG
jgi:hypothetical protein